MHVGPEESVGEEVTLHGDDVFLDERAENADERIGDEGGDRRSSTLKRRRCDDPRGIAEMSFQLEIGHGGLDEFQARLKLVHVQMGRPIVN